MNIIRKRLDPNEIYPSNQRYNSDCDCIQVTNDGGTTWTDAPQFDPRTSLGFQTNPASSSDPRCDAGASIVANMRSGLEQAVEELSATSDAATIATTILTFLEFLTGIGILIALITDLALAIISLGATAIEAAFTDAVWAQLQCIFYCNVQSDGTFNQANFEAIQTQVSDSFGEFSTVNIVVQGWLKPLGPVGLTNVAALKHVTGDCSSCSCTWCVDIMNDDLLNYAWAWLAGYEAQGIWDNVNKRYVTVAIEGHSVLYMLLSFLLPTGSTLTQIGMWWNTSGSTNTDTVSKKIGYDAGLALTYGEDGSTFTFTQYVEWFLDAPRPFIELDLSTPATGQFSIAASIDANSTRNDLYIYGFRLVGTGFPPAPFTPNCT